MVNVVVAGATGKLGKSVCELIIKSNDLKLVGAIVSPNGENGGKEIYPGVFGKTPNDLKELLKNADVYVDLTTPDAASKIVDKIPETKTNMIIGTTAINKDTLKRMEDNTKKYKTSSLVSSNFSVGVNVFWKICEELAKALPTYDIEVVETHHNKKKDAPSGTAMETVKHLQKATDISNVIYGREGNTGARKKEICVHSIRAGDVVGDHTVIFAGEMERIELSHKAISREIFAIGCVKAIRWISSKNDGKVHEMSEVLDL